MSLKKKSRSGLQELLAIQRTNNALSHANIPSNKEMIQIRSKRLAMEFLANNASPDKTIETLESFSKKHNIAKSTLSKALNILTNTKLVNLPPSSNNISKYHTEKKKILQKYAYNEKLTEEEQTKLEKYKQTDQKRRKTLDSKKNKKNEKKSETLKINITHSKKKGGYEEHEYEPIIEGLKNAHI